MGKEMSGFGGISSRRPRRFGRDESISFVMFNACSTRLGSGTSNSDAQEKTAFRFE